MIGGELLIAGCGLVLAVTAGLLAHEYAHAVVLRLAGIEYTMTFAPARTGGVGGLLASYPWAVVRPSPTGEEPPWVFRVGALAPFALAIPVWLGIDAGVVTTDSPLAVAIAVGWLACAIPSPQDFSVAFYAHRQLDGQTRRSRIDGKTSGSRPESDRRPREQSSTATRSHSHE